MSSCFTHARQLDFEDLLLSVYEGVREGVRLSGADQPFVDLADAVRVSACVCMYVYMYVVCA